MALPYDPIGRLHIVSRADGVSSATAVSQCSGWGTNMNNMGLRIGSIFIILTGSMLGAFLPMLLSRTSPNWRFSNIAFSICKYFGSGVILATAFMHLLSPAVEALSDKCLSNRLPDYDWGHSICLMTIMVMFYIELMAARFNFNFGHSHGPSSSSLDVNLSASGLPKPEQHSHSGISRTNGVVHGGSSVNKADANSSASTKAMTSTAGSSTLFDVEAGDGGRSNESLAKAEAVRTSINARRLSGLPGGAADGEDHLAHGRDHVEGDQHAGYGSQIVSLLILEFGVVFHSLFIGLSLAGADNLKILLIVIAFHQFFEGLGLGSRLAVAPWPSNWKAWTGILMAVGYAVTTPMGIAIGLGVNTGLSSRPELSQLVNGVFDAVSAGILIYTALVELLAHEFMFNPEMRDASLAMQHLAFGCVAAGAGVMALLAKWA